MSDDGIGRIRIMVAEASGITRDSVRALLQSDRQFEVIGAHASLEDCLADIALLEPDVLLTELTLKGAGSGLDLITRALAAFPRTACVVLAHEVQEAGVRTALSAGASGFVAKKASTAELITALCTVHAGERYLCQITASRVLSAYMGAPAKSKPMNAITPREKEVLIQVALGNSNKIIAREMGLSPKTVEKHRSNLMRKLHLRGSAAATAFAITHGLAGGRAPARRHY
jgi:DNA-binding NarL/FixJ family response regulator